MDNAIEYPQCRLNVMNIPQEPPGIPVIQLMEDEQPRKEIQSVKRFIRKTLNRSQTLLSKLITLSWINLTHVPLEKMATILADDIYKLIFLNENDRIPIRISLKFVPRGPFDNEPALVQVMAWR